LGIKKKEEAGHKKRETKKKRQYKRHTNIERESLEEYLKDFNRQLHLSRALKLSSLLFDDSGAGKQGSEVISTSHRMQARNWASQAKNNAQDHINEQYIPK